MKAPKRISVSLQLEGEWSTNSTPLRQSFDYLREDVVSQYIEHQSGCKTWWPHGGTCSCGLNEIIKK